MIYNRRWAGRQSWLPEQKLENLHAMTAGNKAGHWHRLAPDYRIGREKRCALKFLIFLSARVSCLPADHSPRFRDSSQDIYRQEGKTHPAKAAVAFLRKDVPGKAMFFALHP